MLRLAWQGAWRLGLVRFWASRSNGLRVTTTTAARAGVPQIVVPHVFDQFYWARRVAELGIGPPGPRRRRLAAAPLAEALAATLDNGVLLERAREFGARLRSRAASGAALPFRFDGLDA